MKSCLHAQLRNEGRDSQEFPSRPHLRHQENPLGVNRSEVAEHVLEIAQIVVRLDHNLELVRVGGDKLTQRLVIG